MELDQTSGVTYPNRVKARLSKLPWLEIGILALALFLRVLLIDIKPAHFDEGINGAFADKMASSGYYDYDPTNFHGPLHFYAVFLSQTLFGRNLLALRLPAIIASLLCVWMLLRFRPFFGAPIARLAALAMAVSPAFVFYGRYSIHESEQVLFGILFLWGILGLLSLGEARFLYATVLSAAGMVLTKETYAIHLGSFGLAGLTLWLWEKAMPSQPVENAVRRLWTWRDAAIATGLAVFSIVFFYSGTFLNWPGLVGLVQTFHSWFATGVSEPGHQKTAYDIVGPLNYYWLYLMARYEWPALLGFIACLRYAFPSPRALRYVAIYGAGVLLAYSIIPYKTPWCIISILWPFYFLFAAFALELAKTSRLVITLIVGLSLLGSLIQCVRLNFFHFTDETEPYVYVQTYKEIETFTQPLREMARRDPRIHHASGIIYLESYYPLPWELGDFTRVGYYNSKENTPPSYDADFLVIQKSDEGKVEPSLTDAYYKRSFRLRDAQEECTAYFRRSLFSPWFGGTAEIQAPPKQ